VTLATVRQHGRDLCRLVLRSGSRLVRVEWCSVAGLDANYRTLGRALAGITSAFGYVFAGPGLVKDAGLEVVLTAGALDDVPEYIRPIVRRVGRV